MQTTRTRHQEGIELVAHWSAYETGKAYAARLLGPHARYGFDREFLRHDPATGHTTRSGASGARSYWVDRPGVYEVQSSGRKAPRREYWLVEETEQGLAAREVTAAEARALVS